MLVQASYQVPHFWAQYRIQILGIDPRRITFVSRDDLFRK